MLVCCIIFHELVSKMQNILPPKHGSTKAQMRHWFMGSHPENSWSAICSPRIHLFLLCSANSLCRREEDASILGEEHGSCKKMMTNSCLSLVSGGLMCWFGEAASFLCALGFQTLYYMCIIFCASCSLGKRKKWWYAIDCFVGIVPD